MAQLAIPHHSKGSGLVSGLAPRENATGFQFQLIFMSRSISLGYRLQQILKRMADILLAGVGILMISPALLAIALLIRLTSPGPVLYMSERIGKDYKPFKMYKFRTMEVDADRKRETLRKEANLDGELFKIANDPRVTPIGKLLRATSLDELPQLFNVLRGEMSLVGPRPLPPDESHLFEAPYTLRYQVFPGITGKWQVNGRSNADFKTLCELEMTYVMNWSLFEDFKLMVQTIPAVLLSRGAY